MKKRENEKKNQEGNLVILCQVRLLSLEYHEIISIHEKEVIIIYEIRIVLKSFASTTICIKVRIEVRVMAQVHTYLIMLYVM